MQWRINHSQPLADSPLHQQALQIQRSPSRYHMDPPRDPTFSWHFRPSEALQNEFDDLKAQRRSDVARVTKSLPSIQKWIDVSKQHRNSEFFRMWATRGMGDSCFGWSVVGLPKFQSFLQQQVPTESWKTKIAGRKNCLPLAGKPPRNGWKYPAMLDWGQHFQASSGTAGG